MGLRHVALQQFIIMDSPTQQSDYNQVACAPPPSYNTHEPPQLVGDSARGAHICPDPQVVPRGIHKTFSLIKLLMIPAFLVEGRAPRVGHETADRFSATYGPGMGRHFWQ